MGFFKDGFSSSERRARASMEDAAGKNTKSDFQEKLQEETGDAEFAKRYRNRGRLYDKIKIPLHTLDIIIYVLVGLIVAALVVGIAIGQ